MDAKQASSTRRWRGVIAEIKGSLAFAGALLLWDIGYDGFYVFSFLICPLWFLITVIKDILRRPGWGIAALRLSIPLLTLAIAMGNGKLQWRISDANAGRVIKACEEFRDVNGRYPDRLEELVPEYLASVPPAKHCLTGKFFYTGSGDQRLLMWARYGFYRRIYSFYEKRWNNLD